MVYTIRGSICITIVSAWVYFFEKKFSRAEGCAEDSTFSWILRAKFISLLVFLFRGRNRFRGVASRVGGIFQTRAPLSLSLVDG